MSDNNQFTSSNNPIKSDTLLGLGKFVAAMLRDNFVMKIHEIFEHALKLHQLGKIVEAIELYSKVLTVEQNNSQLFYLIGTAYLQNGQHDQSVYYLTKSVKIDPRNPFAFNNLSVAFNDTKKSFEAVESCNKAISLKTDYAEAYYNRGNALRDLNRLSEAIDSYNIAIAINPDYIEAHWNKSLLMILMGKYLESWEIYEWRIKKADRTKSRYFDKPSWRGAEDITGKKILIYSEQGLGDVIWFSRYIPMVKALGAEVIVEAPERLLPLLSTLNCQVEFITEKQPLPEFHACCPIMSMAFIFQTTVETIPDNVPYLYSDTKKVHFWKEKLGIKTKPRIGIAWSGSKDYRQNSDRNVALSQLLTIAIPNIELHSLQIEYTLEDFDTINNHPEIYQHQDNQNDFSDTAALIECMDLVISVETSVAQVAGAMGKPLWVLLSTSPYHFWMLDREDSPWYPNARLFRQSEPGDWQTVLLRVKQELTKIVEGKEQLISSDRYSDFKQPPATLNASINSPFIPVSFGELIDKITILEIKASRIIDPSALGRINAELELLGEILKKQINQDNYLSSLRNELKKINEHLWDIENGIRSKENNRLFDDEFIQLARLAYQTNDRRSAIKREINLVLNSGIIEEKKYSTYKIENLL